MPTRAEINAATRDVFAKAKRGEIVSSDPLAMLDAVLDVKVLEARRA